MHEDFCKAVGLEDYRWRFALHGWTLGVGAITETIAAAAATGYDAIELSWQDFEAAAEPPRLDDVQRLLDESGLTVAAIGVKPGWMFASGDEMTELFDRFGGTCHIAQSLRCPLVIAAVGSIDGVDAQALANIRTAVGIAGEYGLSLALEPNFQHPRLNTPIGLMRLIDLSGGRCGIVLDSYHLHRANLPGACFADIPASMIALVHASDVPARPAFPPEPPLDRLLPGEGKVLWEDFFRLLGSRGYRGHVSFEAPNPEHWTADARRIARQGLWALRKFSGSESARDQGVSFDETFSENDSPPI